MPAEGASPPGIPAGLVIGEVRLELVLPLRARILRAGRPVEAARSKQDARPGTLHVAARREDGSVVGVVTVFPEDTSVGPGQGGMRFRGMAVDERAQGLGIGRALIREVVRLARAQGARYLWANGRDTALGFYERIGFRTVGDGFVDGEMHLGHHVVIAGLDDIRA